MDNVKPTGLASNNTYVPPKPWEELNSDEKVDRMREIVKGLQNSLSRAQTDIHKLKTNFKKHKHHHDNEVVVPYEEYDGGGLVGSASSLSPVGGYF